MSTNNEHDEKAGYWRSLAELGADGASGAGASGGADGPDDDPPGGLTRRDFARLLGASVAMAGVGACTRSPDQPIIPYVTRPPDAVPGVARHYATAMVVDGVATGLLVESHEGRPTKVEGNPEHPASLGASGTREQAAVLSVYDPGRATTLRRGALAATWDELWRAIGAPRADGGAGLRLVLEPQSSPLVAALLARLAARHPAARVTFFSPVGQDASLAGARLLHGRARTAQYAVGAADVLLAIDADFLAHGPDHLRHARAFAARRRPEEGPLNRLYAVETAPTITGRNADHRRRARPSEVTRVGAAILAEALAARSGSALVTDALAPLRLPDDAWVQAVARDLGRSAGTALVLVGEGQPPALHALALAANATLGERAAWLIDTPLLGPLLPTGLVQDLGALATELRAGAVDTLVILEGNPAYTAPAELAFAAHCRAVRTSVYLGLYENETAAACQWFVPAAHWLETWGDARAHDGTLSFVQPLIAPLHGGRALTELLALVAGDPNATAYQLLRTQHVGTAPWDVVLARGLVDGTAFTRQRLTPEPGAVAAAARTLADLVGRGNGAGTGSGTAGAPAYELHVEPDPKLHDGRGAGSAWLLELPDPITQETWGNAALLSPATAAALGVSDGRVVALAVGDRTVLAPILRVPGQADGAVTLRLGWGRTAGEPLALDVGVNAYLLPPTGAAVRITPTTRRVGLARAQTHHDQHDRHILLSATAAAYRAQPDFTASHKGALPTLLPPVAAGDGPQWAMTIDLSACTGCGACAIACQAENNVPLVGPENVREGRLMHWLRIDTYTVTGGTDHGGSGGSGGTGGTADDPQIAPQPMMCQHCETAPCEYVCPVNATVHSPDGLNEMVYNRCVGTRFCSNNCPYKVRRFNWFDWHERKRMNQGLVELQRNPEVTVRERGVMEKCTYCVQRIRGGQRTARFEARPLRDGDVRTACQQACPSEAIRFGSLTHPDADVVRWRTAARSYAVLHETGARPRTMYLARITNPNPELDGT